MTTAAKAPTGLSIWNAMREELRLNLYPLPYTTLPPANLARAMRRSMLAVFPQLDDVAFDHVWGGNVAITVERTPHFGG